MIKMWNGWQIWHRHKFSLLPARRDRWSCHEGSPIEDIYVVLDGKLSRLVKAVSGPQESLGCSRAKLVGGDVLR